MKILFRPLRGSLSESMSESKSFNSLKELFEFLCDFYSDSGLRPFDISDLYISYYCYDDRIDWDTYSVCTSRFFNDYYCFNGLKPQICGFLTFKD